MLDRVKARLTYANVMATVAVFIALGGTSVAATALINGSKLKNRTVAGKKLKNRTVAGKKLKTNTVRGTEVRESTLGPVPRALQADDAMTLDQLDSSAFLPRAAKAADADALDGADSSSFLRSDRIAAGRANQQSVPAATFFSFDDLGVTVTTDGDSDADQTIRIADTNPSTAVDYFTGDSSGAVGFIAGPPGTLFTAGTGYNTTGDGSDEVTVLLRIGTVNSQPLLVHCYLASANVWDFCYGIRQAP